MTVDAGDAVRSLSRHHRMQGSRGYRAAADWLRGELRAAGLADAAVESLPADGKTRYGRFKSYLGCSARLHLSRGCLASSIASRQRAAAPRAPGPVLCRGRPGLTAT